MGTFGKYENTAAFVKNILKASTVLDISEDVEWLNALRACGIQVTRFAIDSSLVRSGAFDLVTCSLASPKLTFDVAAKAAALSDRIMIVPDKAVQPLIPWLMHYSTFGFAPDPDFAGVTGCDAVLMKRGLVWPPDALRVFAAWNGVQRSAERMLALEAELRLQSERVAELSALCMLYHESNLAPRGNLQPPQHPETLARLEALERDTGSLLRANEHTMRVLESILSSRTWKGLTSAGGVLLKISRRKL